MIDKITKYSYTPSTVCSRQIDLQIDESGVVRSVEFTGGCHGNTQGIAALVKGMKAEDVAQKLAGIDCKGKGTSCPDQLSKALINAIKRQ